jgi:hypothetical protein
MLLPRLANWLSSPDLLLLRPTIIVKVFVISDVSTFLIQAAGGGMSATGGSMAATGEKVGCGVAAGARRVGVSARVEALIVWTAGDIPRSHS